MRRLGCSLSLNFLIHEMVQRDRVILGPLKLNSDQGCNLGQGWLRSSSKGAPFFLHHLDKAPGLASAPSSCAEGSHPVPDELEAQRG